MAYGLDEISKQIGQGLDYMINEVIIGGIGKAFGAGIGKLAALGDTLSGHSEAAHSTASGITPMLADHLPSVTPMTRGPEITPVRSLPEISAAIPQEIASMASHAVSSMRHMAGEVYESMTSLGGESLAQLARVHTPSQGIQTGQGIGIA